MSQVKTPPKRPCRDWLRQTAEGLGGFPDDYTVVDLETNGLDPQQAATLPIEFGWLLVLNRQPQGGGSFVLDWTRAGIDAGWLGATLDETREAMASRGHRYPYSLDYLREHGVAPVDGLKALRELLHYGQITGRRLVGHNIYAFDRPILDRAFLKCSMPLALSRDLMFDTALLEKGRLLKYPPPTTNKAGDWYATVAADRRHGHYGLATGCAKTYGYAVNKAEAHGAAYDCQLGHTCLEAIRNYAEAPHGPGEG